MLGSPYQKIHSNCENIYYALEGFNDEHYLAIETIFKYKQDNKIKSLIQGVELIRTIFPTIVLFNTFINTKKQKKNKDTGEIIYDTLKLEDVYKSIKEHYDYADRTIISTLTKRYEIMIGNAKTKEEKDFIIEKRDKEINEIKENPTMNKYDWKLKIKNDVIDSLIKEGYNFFLKEKLSNRTSNIYMIKDNGFGVLVLLIVHIVDTNNLTKVVEFRNYAIDKTVANKYLEKVLLKGGK